MGAVGFSIDDHLIGYYGLMIAVGVICAGIVGIVQVRRCKLSINDFCIIAGICALGGVLGAKLLYLLVSIKDIDLSRLGEIEYLNSLMRGGFVFLGGVLGGLLGLYLCNKRFGLSTAPYVQNCIAVLPIAHGFGRIGCFLVGCCHGGTFTGEFAVTYTESLFAPNGIPLFPVQLIEAILDFTIAGLLLAFSRKLKGYSGVYLYLLLYSALRFLLEFLRGDAARGGILGTSTSQALSILLFFFAAINLIRSSKAK